MPRAAGALLAALLFALFVGPVSAVGSGCSGSVPETRYWKNADAAAMFPLCGFAISSVTSEGLSFWALDPLQGRIVQLQIAGETKLTRVTPDPPSPVAPANAGDSVRAVLLIGPRAFYALATTPIDDVPTLFRADRVPTSMRGGWKSLRHIAGPAGLGLAAVAMDNTIWMLRSDANDGFNVDWQPVATENNANLAPPGPTIRLGGPAGTREAAGVTATRDAIYAFGGRALPFDAVRIPLVNGSPQPAVPLNRLRHARTGATALVHATTLYLVGGNQPGEPTIERASILRDGSLGPWEKYPEPPGTPRILTAAFARGYLWIFREDGSIQKSRIGDAAVGRSRVVWKADTRPYTVAPGQTVTLPLAFTYDGPRELTGLSATASGSLVDPRSKSSGPIAGLQLNAADPPLQNLPLGSSLLGPDATLGPDMNLVVRIPNERRRSQFIALVQLHYTETVVDAAGVTKQQTRSLGPLLRLRFVVKKTPI